MEPIEIVARGSARALEPFLLVTPAPGEFEEPGLGSQEEVQQSPALIDDGPEDRADDVLTVECEGMERDVIDHVITGDFVRYRFQSYKKGEALI